MNIKYMQAALLLAQQTAHPVSPNPFVGCVIVRDDHVVGRGFHQGPGTVHAEVMALKEAGPLAQGADLYVTLEPCCHYGRTPPCINAIIAAGIQRVFIAMIDPNPLVAGKGIEQLKQQGIEVHVGLCAQEAFLLNEWFCHFMQTQTPWVIAKWAMSLDGQMITAPKDQRQLTGAETQQHTHALRQSVDAILVGANTVREDNPQLTTRLIQGTPRHPLRIIVSRSAQLPMDAQVFKGQLPGKTLLVTTTDAHQKQCDLFRQQGVEVLQLPEDPMTQEIPLPLLLKTLGARGISRLLVEGGPIVLKKFLTAQAVQEIHTYVAPVIIARLPKKQIFSSTKTKMLGSDIHIHIRRA